MDAKSSVFSKQAQSLSQDSKPILRVYNPGTNGMIKRIDSNGQTHNMTITDSSSFMCKILQLGSDSDEIRALYFCNIFARNVNIKIGAFASDCSVIFENCSMDKSVNFSNGLPGNVLNLADKNMTIFSTQKITKEQGIQQKAKMC